MAVALATLRDNVWDTLYNHLQTGTYALSTNNIHASYNNLQYLSEGHPQVIIHPVIVKKTMVTIGGDIKRADINFVIEVIHNSAENLRVLMDEVENKIDTGEDVFTVVNLTPDYKIQDSDRYEQEDASAKKTHHRGYINRNYYYTGGS